MEDFSREVFPPTLERIFTHLDKVRKSQQGWTACCPSHDDQTPSLSIGLGKDGQVLLHCFVGCTYEAIVEALGLQPSYQFAF